jgi:hemolysin-activating ACP:hemolysin acyltransferase
MSPEEAKQRVEQEMRQSIAFAQIVTLLLRSPVYRHYSLSDLEWLVIPALMTGQFAVAEAKTQEDGPPFPVAMALWALVSPEIDRRLSENLAAPIRIRPDEWRSGDILWLVDAVGDNRALPDFVKHLAASAFKDRAAKVRQIDANGKPMVGTIGGPQTTA